uniref:Uncharacterized protein n=1 Tax=Arundo donax TaxID=35708 RepID=A0A0A8Z1F5_ARUDO
MPPVANISASAPGSMQYCVLGCPITPTRCHILELQIAVFVSTFSVFFSVFAP